MIDKDIIIKEVDFNGASLMAFQDPETGKIYVGVRWVCEGLGLSEGQRNRQMLNIQSDLALSKGVSNLVLPTKGGQQEVSCIELDFLPLWLAKIPITPTMKKRQPEIAERLVEYQLHAKDVLADAFIHKALAPVTAETILNDPDAMFVIIQNFRNEKQKRLALEAKIEEDKPLVQAGKMLEVSETSILIGEYAKVLRQKGYPFGQNRLFERLRRDGYLCRVQGRAFNSPTQRAMELGLFEIKETPVRHTDGRVTTEKTPLITGKGQIYFLNRLIGGQTQLELFEPSK